MNWRIGPWQEIYLLKCKVKWLEEAYQRTKTNELNKFLNKNNEAT